MAKKLKPEDFETAVCPKCGSKALMQVIRRPKNAGGNLFRYICKETWLCGWAAFPSTDIAQAAENWNTVRGDFDRHRQYKV